VTTPNDAHNPKVPAAWGHIIDTHWSWLSLVGLTLIVVGTFGAGLTNLPVAEDFCSTNEYLHFVGNTQFRPVFGLLMLGIQTSMGSITEHPLPYYALTIGIHLAATLAVYWLGFLLTSSSVFAGIMSVIFATYPRHHEPVFWSAASVHSLMTLFVVLSFICFLYSQRRRRVYWAVGSLVLMGLALLSSQAAIALPALILGYQLIVRSAKLSLVDRCNWWTLTRPAVGHIAIAAAYAVMLFISTGNSRLLSGESGGSYGLVLGPNTITDIIGYYTYAIYPLIPLRSMSGVQKILVTISAIAVTIVPFVLRSRLSIFGLIWVTSTILPYVLFVPFGNADRYFYLSSIGVSIAYSGTMLSLFRWLIKTSLRPYIKIIFAIFIISLSSYAFICSSYIRDRQEEWRTSGEDARITLEKIYEAHPSLTGAESFYIVGASGHYGQARHLELGIRSAMRSHYGIPGLMVQSTDWPELIEYLSQDLSTSDAPGPRFLYLYREGELVNLSHRLDEEAVQRQLMAHGRETC
jgi:hypothetical protein